MSKGLEALDKLCDFSTKTRLNKWDMKKIRTYRKK